MIVEAAIANPYIVKSFVAFVCNELNIKPKRITVAEWEELEGNTIGLCIDESEDEFIILVKDNLGERAFHVSRSTCRAGWLSECCQASRL